MKLNFTKLSLLLLFLFPLMLAAQFPTAIGTKWEFFQYFEVPPHPMNITDAFQDEVIGDTIVGNLTYQIVNRTGRMGHGYIYLTNYDTLSGHWYYRVTGTQVRVLDMMGAGAPNERLLYEFGLNIGDTLQEIPVDLMDLTPLPPLPHYLENFNTDSACANMAICASSYVMQHTNTTGGGFIEPSDFWDVQGNTYFLDDIGTTLSFPFLTVLDVNGQYYILGKLNSGGQTLYTHPFRAMALDENKLGLQVSVYPNPAVGQVHVEAETRIVQVEIFNMLGASLRKIDFENPRMLESIDLADMPKGQYFLSVVGEEKTAMKHIILQ